MTTPPSKQLNGERPSSSCDLSADNVLFNNGHDLTGCSLIFVFFGVGLMLAVSLLSLWFIFCSPLLLVWMYACLASVEELSIDFSQRTYRVRKGTWPWVGAEMGSLSQVSHLRLAVRNRAKVHHRSSFGKDYLEVSMVWKNSNPQEFALKDEFIGFTGFDNTASRTKAKNWLEPYATALAARLLVPVIDETNCAT